MKVGRIVECSRSRSEENRATGGGRRNFDHLDIDHFDIDNFDILSLLFLFRSLFYFIPDLKTDPTALETGIKFEHNIHSNI